MSFFHSILDLRLTSLINGSRETAIKEAKRPYSTFGRRLFYFVLMNYNLLSLYWPFFPIDYIADRLSGLDKIVHLIYSF